MSPRARAFALLPAGLLAAALVTGCGGSGSTGGPSSAPSGSSSSAPSDADLAHMQKLVNDADSAAAVAESDAASDK